MFDASALSGFRTSLALRTRAARLAALDTARDRWAAELFALETAGAHGLPEHARAELAFSRAAVAAETLRQEIAAGTQG